MLISTTAFLTQASDSIVSESLSGTDWIRAGAILISGVLAATVTSRMLRRFLSRGVGIGLASIITARLAAYTVFLVGLFYALTTLGVQVGPLLGALGLGGLVLALALQKLVENFVAGLLLQARRPFTVGDTVELDGHVGTVVDIDSRVTVLRALDGRAIRIPNGIVASTTIINLTREPSRRTTLQVGVAYNTDLTYATEVIDAAISRVPRVLTHPHPVVSLDNFGDSSIVFDIYFWHGSDVPSGLAARHDLMIAIHQAFAAAGIEIAFPQMVVWSGQVDPSALYTEDPTEVHTPRPGIDQPARQAPKRRSISIRPATWRSSTSDET